MRVKRIASCYTAGQSPKSNSQKMLMPAVKSILVAVVLVSSQLMLSLNSVMTSSVSSMETTAIFSVIKRSNAYVIPASGITVVQSLFAQSLLHCSTVCKTLQAGSATTVCSGFIFTSRYCNQSTFANENCQLVSFNSSTTVLLNELTPGLQCQRFFSFKSLWPDG